MSKEEILEELEKMLNESFEGEYVEDRIRNTQKNIMTLWKKLMQDVYLLESEKK